MFLGQRNPADVSLTWLVPQEEAWPFGSVSLPEEGMPGFPLRNSRESGGVVELLGVISHFWILINIHD